MPLKDIGMDFLGTMRVPFRLENSGSDKMSPNVLTEVSLAAVRGVQLVGTSETLELLQGV